MNSPYTHKKATTTKQASIRREMVNNVIAELPPQYNTEIINFIYGLTLLLVGSGILAFNHRESNQSLSFILPALAVYAIFHGLSEWLRLWPELNQYYLTNQLYLALHITSFVALFEFGRRLILLSTSTELTTLHRLLSAKIYLPLFVVFIVGASSNLSTSASVYAWGSYVFALLGSLLTAIGFLLYYRNAQVTLEPLNLRRYFSIIAVCFFGYALIEGIIVPTQILFPMESAAQNSTWLYYAHAACSIIAVLCIAYIARACSKDSHQRTLAIQRQIQQHLDQQNDALFVALDPQGLVIWINKTGYQQLGYSEGELEGQDWFKLCVSPSNQNPPLASYQHLITKKEKTQHEQVNTVRAKCGEEITISWDISLLQGNNGTAYGTLNSGQELEEQKRLKKNLDLTAKIFHNMPDGVVVINKHAIIVSVNPSFEAASGYSKTELIGQNIRIIKSGHHEPSFYQALWAQLQDIGMWQGEVWNRRKSGEIYPEWLTVSAIKNGQGDISHYAGIFSDVNTQQHIQRRLQRLAYYDPLTGLPNRAHFYDYLGRELQKAKRDGLLFGIMFLDFDRFKTINDTLGHSVGDTVLKTIAMRLKKHVRDSDIVARLGGDEFVILLPELPEPRHAIKVVEKLMRSFVESVVVHNHDLFVTASIGISIYPFDGDDGETLIKNADTAMYHAKEQGRNKYHFYTAEMSARFRERLILENGLRRAIENNELYLAYQPQIDIRTKRVVGIEALARWKHPDFGDIPPEQFINLAEENGLIIRLGEWVLDKACAQAKLWSEMSPQRFRIAINISAHQLLQPELCDTIAHILTRHNLDPRYLELELTETVLMQDVETTISTLQRLSSMGIELAIDDFGTGYSSLSYLKRFAIDKLKIDRSFVKDVPDDTNDAAIAATVIAMGRNLGLEVIAEGVETLQQTEFLRARGCHIMQGMLFSPPVSPEDITSMLQHRIAQKNSINQNSIEASIES